MISNNNKLNKVIQECRETGIELPESMLSIIANLLSSSRLSWTVFPTFRKSIQIEHETEDNYIEFEIFDDDRVIMLRMTDDHVDEEREITSEEMHYIVWGLEK